MAIDNENKRLEKENSDLRTVLKLYLDGISVNEDVLNSPSNPLLVINNKLQVRSISLSEGKCCQLRSV